MLLFGSLARGDFRADSDIDLCVDTLPPHLFYAVYAELERIVAPFDLDLLVLEDLNRPEHHELRAVILREGMELP
ncbi:nucleotidyltransferase family protein [Caldinitratiruptor microaerophilus]|uniref:nucleotidyltransferase family protein n=1 Tax=Caldinitratiruptor microaerophilus TaxID=671077 RepID=UPI00387399AC